MNYVSRTPGKRGKGRCSSISTWFSETWKPLQALARHEYTERLCLVKPKRKKKSRRRRGSKTRREGDNYSIHIIGVLDRRGISHRREYFQRQGAHLVNTYAFDNRVQCWLVLCSLDITRVINEEGTSTE